MKIHLNIAVMDDDVVDANNIKETLIHQLDKHSFLTYQIDIHQQKDTLLNKIHEYDCIFLDVEIGETNGLDLARQIRIQNQEIYIIFVSSFSSYVFKSFNVQPFTYILKKDLETQGIIEINRFIHHYNEANKLLILKINNQEYTMLQKDIILIEKCRNTCVFYFKAEKINVRFNIKDILHQLTNYFILINKSEIINLHFISNIEKDTIKLHDGSLHYISRRKKQEVLEHYYHFLKNTR